MIKSAEIQNFRGFKLTNLTGLSRINVVVGDNGVGKTALLEALFLGATSSADIPTRFHAWRGAGTQFTASGTPQEIYDGLFLDIFHNMSKSSIVSINLTGTDHDSRSVKIYYDTGEPTLLPFDQDSRSGSQVYHTPITFEWKDAGGEVFKATPRLQGTGLAVPPPRSLAHDPTFLAARVPLPTAQNATWFSSFSKRGQEKRLISALQVQFPYIESINVEVDMGLPTLFVKMPWLEVKVPIYLASDGLNKLVTILLHLAYSTGTVFLIDEVENGFHYGRQAVLWKQLLSFAEEYETQVFMATHSWEFLESGAPLIEKFPDDFSLIQVTQDNGISDAVVVPGKNAAAAINSGIDVRAPRRGIGQADRP